jgi:septum formation protein
VPPSLVVATTSPYRLALLDRLGLRYTAVPHRVDERRAQPTGDGMTVARALAVAKAESVAHEHPDALVLGSDQVVELDGELLGKPGDEAGARAQLARMAGRTHHLVTAVALRRPDGLVDDHVDLHVMRMRALTPAQIASYVARDLPLDCAGSYKIEALGIALLEAIHGDDHTAIIGLPLMATVRLLAGAGLDVLAG